MKKYISYHPIPVADIDFMTREQKVPYSLAASWKWLVRQKKGLPANFEVPKSALETKKEIPEVKQVEK